MGRLGGHDRDRTPGTGGCIVRARQDVHGQNADNEEQQPDQDCRPCRSGSTRMHQDVAHASSFVLSGGPVGSVENF